MSRVAVPENFDDGVAVRVALSKVSAVPVPSSFESDVLRKLSTTSSPAYNAKFKYAAVAIGAALIISAIVFFATRQNQSTLQVVTPQAKQELKSNAGESNSIIPLQKTQTQQRESLGTKRSPILRSSSKESNLDKKNTPKSDGVIRGGKVKKEDLDEE